MDIGDLRIDPVLDGTMTMPATAFQGTTDEQWAPHRRFLDAQGRLEFALGGFLVRGPGGRIVLAREIEGTDVPVAAAHFPGMVFGRLLSANGRRQWLV